MRRGSVAALLALLALFVGAPTTAAAQEDPRPTQEQSGPILVKETPRALDLPSGGGPKSIEVDEPAGPTSRHATLFGLELQGPAIHLCFSAYSSVGYWQADATFLAIQAQITEALGKLTFGTVVGAASYDCYDESTLALPIDPTWVDDLTSWVNSQDVMGIQHVVGALEVSIAHADEVALEGQRIVVVARGVANDIDQLAAVTAGNTNAWPIDVVYLAEEGQPDGSGQWTAFAEANGGTFHLVENGEAGTPSP